MHINLFAHGNRQEVYAALQRDMKSDETWSGIFCGGAVFCFAAAGHYGLQDGWIWLTGGLFGAIFGLRRFIDASNRNFAMHLIDWMDEKQSGQ